jgi:hypothetical protein
MNHMVIKPKLMDEHYHIDLTSKGKTDHYHSDDIAQVRKYVTYRFLSTIYNLRITRQDRDSSCEIYKDLEYQY